MISFNNTNPNFSTALKNRVNLYFSTSEIKPTGNWRLFLKTAILLTSALGLYTTLVFFTPSIPLALLCCVAFGINLAAIGFNVMHDGAHGSYSQNHSVNEAMGYSLNLLGGNAYLWKMKHNVTHHTYTNIEGHDDDIDIRPFIRSNPHQEMKWYHRHQHLYSLFLYCFTTLTWTYLKDFEKYFSGKVSGKPFKKLDAKEHVIFWVSKTAYLVAYLLIPMMKLGVVKALLGYFVVSFSLGFVISTVFQLAHVMPNCSFPLPDPKSEKIEQNWMVHQLATTSNFATENRFISWMAGGLNFQVEHHLFPKISHVHYPKLRKIVKEVCQEYQVPYLEYPTLMTALRAHILHLKAMGSEAPEAILFSANEGASI